MKLDINKWNEVRKKVEAEIKAMKNTIRRVDKTVYDWKPKKDGSGGYEKVPTGATYRGGTYEEYSELGGMKWNATTLYAVRAAMRNKQHCPDWTIEDAIAKILPEYSLPAEETKAE